MRVEQSVPRDVAGLLRWLDEAPPGTTLTADAVAHRLRDLPACAAPQKRAEFLTADEAAELLSMSAKFVYAHQEELGGRRFGTALRFPRRSVERFARRPS